MRINDYICTCGCEEFALINIDGPNHYSDYDVDTYDLLKCTQCNSLHKKIVCCERYDMTGDHDEYSISIFPMSLSELSNILVSLEKDMVSMNNKPLFHGRQFIGAKKWAEEYGDAKLIELVRLQTTVK